ncbi:MAG: hypothetical protein IJV92_07255 [Phascolarctobacterium sp.]|nr:hypothetical protein [Phascolarctobacterium sp.]
MKEIHLCPRIIMMIVGLICMTFGIVLSCKAYLGTTPISSLPLVLSLCIPWSFGEVTIFLNIAFVLVQPLLMKGIYWRELIGQVLTTLFFGNMIDWFMKLLEAVVPANLFEQWVLCLLSVVFIAFGVFLCVRAKIFMAAGEGVVIAIAFALKKEFSFIKNCFDISLVLISIIISIYEFGALNGVGIGTIAGAVLVGRMVALYQKQLKFFDRWSVGD